MSMDKERWRYVMGNYDAKLTEDEVKEGWHFCYEWDSLLVGPGMPEGEVCSDSCGKYIPSDRPS